MNLYMAVTADKYELPLCVEEAPSILSRRFGLKPHSVSHAICNKLNGRKSGVKFIKVEVDDD